MDETITPQEGMNPELEVAEETVEEETNETPIEEVYEETVPKSQFNQVLARAKKAEEQLKKTVSAPQQQNITNKQNSISEEDIEVKILKSQGMSDDLITDLKAVAKARGKSLLDSTTDTIFVAIKAEKEAETRSQKAKLGASKGSAFVKKEKGFNSQGLTDAEHKELWRENRDK